MAALLACAAVSYFFASPKLNKSQRRNLRCNQNAQQCCRNTLQQPRKNGPAPVFDQQQAQPHFELPIQPDSRPDSQPDSQPDSRPDYRPDPHSHRPNSSHSHGPNSSHSHQPHRPHKPCQLVFLPTSPYFDSKGQGIKGCYVCNHERAGIPCTSDTCLQNPLMIHNPVELGIDLPKDWLKNCKRCGCGGKRSDCTKFDGCSHHVHDDDTEETWDKVVVPMMLRIQEDKKAASKKFHEAKIAEIRAKTPCMHGPRCWKIQDGKSCPYHHDMDENGNPIRTAKKSAQGKGEKGTKNPNSSKPRAPTQVSAGVIVPFVPPPPAKIYDQLIASATPENAKTVKSLNHLLELKALILLLETFASDDASYADCVVQDIIARSSSSHASSSPDSASPDSASASSASAPALMSFDDVLCLIQLAKNPINSEMYDESGEACLGKSEDDQLMFPDIAAPNHDSNSSPSSSPQ